MKTERTSMQQLWEHLNDAEINGVYEFGTQNFKRYIETIYLPSEKQQHEQTAIHITNVLMDALDNPKGGKFSGEDEFNKYWQNKYGTTNKETLK